MKIYIDITNMLNLGFISGIQRVDREITVRLIHNASFQNNEIVLLYFNDSAKKYIILDNNAYLRFIDGSNTNKNNCFTYKMVSIFDFESGAIFFDLDAVWMNKVKRSFLLPILKNHHVRIITFINDIIPITHPQFCNSLAALKFSNYLSASLQWSDKFIASSKSTIIELEKFQDRMGMNYKDSAVTPFGSDFAKNSLNPEIKIADVAEQIKSKGPYILCVGTIEIRKNHEIILDAFDTKLQKSGIQLVFAGRRGWQVDALLDRIDKHPQKKKGFHFLEGLNDATIDYLYENAFLTVAASFVEGFGLPLIESIMRGTPVLASDIPVFREVGGEFCDYFNPDDADDLAEKVLYLFHNPAVYEAKKKRLSSYKPVTWDQSVDLLSRELLAEREPEMIHSPLKQMVIRSENAAVFLETLRFIENFMPFISEIVVLTSDENGHEILRQYSGLLNLMLLSRSDDHEGNNYSFLRDERVDAEFILSDESFRPLVPISEVHFIRDNRYQAYFCGDFFASELLSDPLFFDKQQASTAAFLKKGAYPSLNYDSHMPQVINKAWFSDILEYHEEVVKEDLCEWSAYFNISIQAHPNDFSVVPYQTLNWQFGPTDLESFVQPEKYYFEDFDDAWYAAGQPYADFSQTWHGGSILENFEKVQVYKNIRQQIDSARIAEKIYSEIYWHRYQELPSFVMEYYSNHLKLCFPDEYGIVNAVDSKIDVHVVWRDIPQNSAPAFAIEWNLRTPDNHPITEPFQVDVLAGQSVVTLRLNAQIIEADVILCITAKMTGSRKEFSKNIRVQTLFL